MSKLVAAIKKCISLIFIYLFNLFPIKNNKIFLFSYYGSQYGDSPKYITEYILERYPKGHFDIVWAFNDLKSKRDLDFRMVKTMSIRYFYELCTSKVVITNFRTTDLFVKRKDQYYIQTWHSSLRLKQIEKDAEGELPLGYMEMAKKDSMKCDLLLSGCKYSTEIFKRAFWYNGTIFEHGIPRNDVLFKNDFIRKEKISRSLGLPIESKIILYAPTFRKDNDISVYDLNYQALLERIQKRFGEEWVILVKLHPHLISKSKELSFGPKVIDATSYDDVQELLCAADILITDYSSLMFDFAITKKPCFLYIPDFEDYINNDRDLYFDLMELPFISATSQHNLLVEIDGFNLNDYRSKLSKFLQKVGTFESGSACKHVVQHVEEVCFGVNPRRGRVRHEAV